MTSSFDACVQKAELVETRVREFLETQTGRQVDKHPPGVAFKAWDLRIDKRDVEEGLPTYESRYEIKFDELFNTTGNFAFEYSYKNERSGLLSSDSEWWVHVIEKEPGQYTAYFILRNVLINELLRYASEGNTRRLVRGGDKFQSKLFLIPIGDINNLPSVKIHSL